MRTHSSSLSSAYYTAHKVQTKFPIESYICPRVQGQDDHEFIAAEFTRLQAEVVNLTQLVNKFFDKLVLQLEQGLESIADQYGGATAPIQA